MSTTNGTYIIAEAGVNHNGSIDMAKKLVDVAVDAGVDAIKFQTFKAEKEISKFAEKADYQKGTTDCSQSQLEMVKALELSKEAHYDLEYYCKKREIQFLSTPFEEESLHLLIHEFDLPLLKIPSGEITNAPFLLQFAYANRPLVLSTGMSTLGEIEQALSVLAYGFLSMQGYVTDEPSLEAFRKAYIDEKGQQLLKKYVTLLHCTTEYPAPFDEVNLRVIETLSKAFDLPVGYSDHTTGIAIPIAAVAVGATVIEKHFTLDRTLPGPDHQASLEPDELKMMVQAIRQVEKSLGKGIKIPSKSEEKNIQVARKSLVAACDIKKGEVFTVKNVTMKRPGQGISPFTYWDYLGKKAERDYEEDELL